MKNPFIQKDSTLQIYAKLNMVARFGTDEEKNTLIKLWKNGDNDVSNRIIENIIHYGTDKHRENIYKVIEKANIYICDEIKNNLILHGPDSVREKILDEISKMKMDEDDLNDDDYDDDEIPYNAFHAIDAILAINPNKIGKYLFSKNRLLSSMAQKIAEKSSLDKKQE